MREIIVIAHDIRSTHNVGSLLRTAEGLGVRKVYLTGYTPYPKTGKDVRLPHLAEKQDRQIDKTALGAATMIEWENTDDITDVIAQYRDKGYAIVGLEQSDKSVPLNAYAPPEKLAIVLGREVEGLDPEILKLCDACLEIPMFGKKESFNVVQAAAMALYHCRFA